VVVLLVALARKASANLVREGRFDYLLVESTRFSEPLPIAEPRLGRRTVLTFPLLPPPQKN
jgi:G3E family GTPase